MNYFRGEPRQIFFRYYFWYIDLFTEALSIMKTVIMVAEKPSLAQSIANILSHKKCDFRKGFNGACSVHEWQGNFPPTGEKVRYKMTSVCGHVMSIDFPGKYNNWDK